MHAVPARQHRPQPAGGAVHGVPLRPGEGSAGAARGSGVRGLSGSGVAMCGRLLACSASFAGLLPSSVHPDRNSVVSNSSIGTPSTAVVPDPPKQQKAAFRNAGPARLHLELGTEARVWISAQCSREFLGNACSRPDFGARDTPGLKKKPGPHPRRI